MHETTSDAHAEAMDDWPAGLMPGTSVTRDSWWDLEATNQVRHEAVRIATAALSLANTRFSELGGPSVKDALSGDLVTDVDLFIERQIVREVKTLWPAHGYRAEEEHNTHGEQEWLWIIDPLDGTNNYAIGIPTYAVALTLLHRGRLAFAVIAQGMSNAIAVAETGRGVSVTGASANYIPGKGGNRAALWLGYSEVRDPARSTLARRYLAHQFDRVLETWAPAVDIFVALKGSLHLVMGINCSGAELPAALLFLRELGWDIHLINARGGSWLSEEGASISFIASAPGMTEAAESLLLQANEWGL